MALLFALVCAAAAGGVWAVRHFARPLVSATLVVEGPIVQAFYSTGTVHPVREFPIRSNTAGTITRLLVDKGDVVTRGQELAVVEDPQLRFRLAKAEAELAEKRQRADRDRSPVLAEYDARLKATRELLAIAQRDQDRLARMLESNAGSQIDLDRAIDRVKTLWIQIESLQAQREAKVLELQREVDVAQAAVGAAEADLALQTLRSPIDGVLLDRPTSIGTRVAINDPLMRVADVRVENLVMRAAVDEEDIASVRPEQEVQMSLYAFPGRLLQGRVSRIYDQADATRRTFEVDVALPTPEPALKPGMTGELAFILARRARTTVVPSQAVQDGAVHVIEGDALQRRAIEAGARSVERVEVLSGLKPGQRVAISAVADLPSGTLVRVRDVDPIEAAALNAPRAAEQPFKSFD